jgi:hypothetical protein
VRFIDRGTANIERIRLEFVEQADDVARAIRRGGSANQLSADEIASTGAAFLARAAGGSAPGRRS